MMLSITAAHFVKHIALSQLEILFFHMEVSSISISLNPSLKILLLLASHPV